MTDSQQQQPKVTVDERSFVHVDGVKVCKVDGGVLQFHDKNKHRAAERGSDCVEIPIQEFVKALESGRRDD